MAWSYRKSVRIAPGLRLNLSKRGIGYSFGIPGFRITKSANGRVSQTRSIPGTGLYERKTLSSPRNKRASTDASSFQYQHRLGMFRAEKNQDNIKTISETIVVHTRKGWTIFVGFMTISAVAGNFGQTTAGGTSRGEALFYTSLITLYFSYRVYLHQHPRTKVITRFVVADSENSTLNNLEQN